MTNLNLKEKLNNKNGITLVALVISIIILLILATVSISLIINSGIINKAKYGVDKYSEKEELEQIKLAVLSAQMKNKGTLTTENLNSELQANLNDNITMAEKIGSKWYYNGYLIDENGNVEKYDKLLPNEYQQVEYIESTGTQYIDTEFTENSPASGYYLQYQNSSNHMGDDTPMGVLNPNRCIATNNGKTRSSWLETGTGHDDSEMVSVGINDIIEHYANFNNDSRRQIIINKHREVYADITNVTTTNDKSCYIFSSNFGRVYGNASGVRVFNAKISLNNDIVRNLIPCYSTTTVKNAEGNTVPANTKGLYDLVEGKFYTNKNSSGDDFIAGPNV